MNMNVARIETAQSYLGKELFTRELINRMRREPTVVPTDAGRFHFLSSFTGVLQSYRDLEQKIIPQEQWFYFGDGVNHALPAGNLREFMDRLRSLDLTALTIHFERGDFAHWMRDVLKSETLECELERLKNQQLSGESLRRALLDALEMETCIVAEVEDPEAIHGLALLHWEWALDLDQNGNDLFETTAYHYRWAKFYWSHLLGRKGYWQWFTQKYYKGPQTNTEEMSTKLFQEVCQTLLNHHYNRCRINFNVGKLNAAVFYLDCLCNWNVLKNRSSLGLYGKPLLNQEWDEAVLEGVDKAVSEILNRWMSEWLKHANEKLDDTTVELPRGISKNFKGTLEFTRPYLELVAQQPQLFQRLLMFVLSQANRWCYETALANDPLGALAIMEDAGPVIRRLESFLNKPETNSIPKPEQKVLSTSYALWAQLIIGNDVKHGQIYAEAAAAWDPGDLQAKELRNEMDQVGVRIRMDQAQAYIQTDEFEKAVEVLHEIDLQKHPDAQKSVHSLLAVTHFQWGMHFANLANKETEDLLKKKILQKIEKTTQMTSAVTYLKEARDHMAEALKYEPGQPVLTQNLEELNEEVKYRPYGVKTQLGIQCFEKGDYDNALTALDGRIPKDFPGYETVIQIRAGSYFRRAIEHANHERFASAVADMQQAHTLVPDNEVVRDQLEELEQIKTDFPHIKAMQKAEALLENEKYYEALTALETIPSTFGNYERVRNIRAVCEFRIGIEHANSGNLGEAIEHLEKAAQYNPGEPVIRQQLNTLYEIQRRGGFASIERHNRAVQKAHEVIEELNKYSSRNPVTPTLGYQLLAKLEEAVTESDGDPQIVALRDQLQQALWGR
jgi:tetratricopeptide (TPR) repeat protein